MQSALEFPIYLHATYRAKKHWEKSWPIQSIAYGEHPRQYYLVVELGAQPAASPWAIYFHGGAWTFGSPEQFLPAARLFLDAGYRVVLPAYRRLPGIGFAGIWEDMERLFDHLQADERFATSPTVVAGMSAGGHMAASLAWRKPWWEARYGSQAPKKVMLFGAPLNLDQMRHPGLRLLRGAENGAFYHQSNPTYWLLQQDNMQSSHLIIHGTADRLVPFQQLEKPQQRLHEITAPTQALQVQLLTGGSHLAAGRWMFEDNAQAQQIRDFIKQR